MPKKKEITENSPEGVSVSAAKSAGAAAGKVAPQGATAEAREPAKSQKVPKLSKKNKSRLPRREKKALQKTSK